MTEMNSSEFVDEDSATFQQFDINVTEQSQSNDLPDFSAIYMLEYVMVYVCLALGVPGNILSAIIWLRRHVTGKNSSALYLAVLAISDILYILINTLFQEAYSLLVKWLFYCIFTIRLTSELLEPLLVCSFSVERLIAISCPLQVRRRMCSYNV